MVPNGAPHGAADLFSGTQSHAINVGEMGGLGISSSAAPQIPKVPATMEPKNSVKAMLMRPKKNR